MCVAPKAPAAPAPVAAPIAKPDTSIADTAKKNKLRSNRARSSSNSISGGDNITGTGSLLKNTLGPRG